jgi:hypothetical protein
MFEPTSRLNGLNRAQRLNGLNDLNELEYCVDRFERLGPVMTEQSD